MLILSFQKPPYLPWTQISQGCTALTSCSSRPALCTAAVACSRSPCASWEKLFHIAATEPASFLSATGRPVFLEWHCGLVPRHRYGPSLSPTVLPSRYWEHLAGICSILYYKYVIHPFMSQARGLSRAQALVN